MFIKHYKNKYEVAENGNSLETYLKIVFNYNSMAFLLYI